LWVSPGAYPRVEHLKGVKHKYALALPTNIRLGWKGLPGTNALAYFEKAIGVTRRLWHLKTYLSNTCCSIGKWYTISHVYSCKKAVKIA